jgi:hypothetical protein
MNRYNIITTVNIQEAQVNESGNVVTVVTPAGSVINTVLWDGASDWQPPKDTTVEPE